MPNDQFHASDHDLDSPAKSGFVITPHDSTDLATPTKGFLVGVGGDVSVEFVEVGTAIVLKNLIAGMVYPLRVSRINLTGTTATNIIGLY